jgi:Zn-finger nucleic acid-binding protein
VEHYSLTQVEECPQCAGVWLDAGELGKLIKDPAALESMESENIPALELEEPATADRRCPKCDAGLESYRYAYSSPIVLDSCVNCYGIWVQDGELARIELYRREGAGSPEDRARAALALARYTQDHNRLVGRQQRIAAPLDLLRRRPIGPPP